jgi:hypothetical protein
MRFLPRTCVKDTISLLFYLKVGTLTSKGSHLLLFQGHMSLLHGVHLFSDKLHLLDLRLYCTRC